VSVQLSHATAEPREQKNLTQLEMAALDAPINLADGHPRQPLTPSQLRIVESLSQLYSEAEQASIPELERTTSCEFVTALGQDTACDPSLEMKACYSSSVAIQMVATALARRTRRVGLVDPTFDNIPALLRAAGLELVAVPEADFVLDPGSCAGRAEVVFLTSPNNPTGQVVAEPALRELAAACARAKTMLVMDASFRGFDRRAQYDHYEVLLESGCEFVVVEDTGKIWPSLELKLGFLVYPAASSLALSKIYSDILLSVSPFTLSVVRAFTADYVAGGADQLHALVATNRAAAREVLGDSGASSPDRDSRLSVERVHLPSPIRADAASRELIRRGVHVLPCGPFHWHEWSEGNEFLRIALARSRDDVVRGCRELANYLELVRPEGLRS
jgi:aspartate/methionine/tyrosine aminotransferase